MKDKPLPWAHCVPLLLGSVGNKSGDYFLCAVILKLWLTQQCVSFPKVETQMLKELQLADPRWWLVPPHSTGRNLHSLNSVYKFWLLNMLLWSLTPVHELVRTIKYY